MEQPLYPISFLYDIKYIIPQHNNPPRNPNKGLKVVTCGIKTIKNTVVIEAPEDIPVT